ncbi:V-type ATP synthase subunit D [Desulfurococcus amylolyticus]|uniref:V-type ATPase, subunit D n=1 Tax=Desulfurococcus amylolyticus (strain DSM 18924 / JCM 16383 / VKM B-2413 / 1221n) TaxID=490899 RepID=B8D5D4_DESA1|nr:V-type ATP synthase subunit D [Desulfurococcus amylolyticus]ACL11315.1 V-type ATPase, subunit D [Desulfurococcus amylolyticus 1221n]
MSSLQRVRPTKIELIRLKRRLEISVKVERILRERLIILTNEFLALLKEGVSKRQSVSTLLINLNSRAVMLSGVYGENIYSLLEKTVPKNNCVVGTENIMGVKTKTAILVKNTEKKTVKTPFDDFIEESTRFIEEVLDLAKTEYALRALGKEIRATKRRVNALDYILIPRLKSTIKILQLKFDEREREEKARLKRVKASLERREK